MKNTMFAMRYYNTYYFANIITNLLENRFAYIRTINDLFEDYLVLDFIGDFPKFTALHRFAEFVFHLECSDELTSENIAAVLATVDKKLTVNHAFDEYAIDHTSLTEWLSDKKTLSSVDADDLYEYYHELRLEQAYADLIDRLTNEVFFVMFLNRRILHSLNDLIAMYVGNLPLTDVPSSDRHLFTRDGVVKRRNIPTWVRRAVFYRDRGICGTCSREISGLVNISNSKHFDHIVPLAQGGINDVTNIQLLCDKCNLAKGGRESGTSTLYERWFPA